MVAGAAHCAHIDDILYAVVKRSRVADAPSLTISRTRHVRRKEQLLPSQVKRKTEDQLVENALKLFSRGGFRETSLQEIADGLGITRPLFYYYFDSKEDLLWRLIGHLGDSLLERARPLAAAEASATERFRLLIESHVRTLLENVDAFRVYFAERHLLEGKRDRRLKRGELAYLELLTDLVAEGQASGEFKSGEPNVLAHLATGTANSVLSWYHPDGATPADQIAALTVEYAISGIVAG
jgi:AcrR family transcriptional regulator